MCWYWEGIFILFLCHQQANKQQFLAFYAFNNLEDELCSLTEILSKIVFDFCYLTLREEDGKKSIFGNNMDKRQAATRTSLMIHIQNY